MKKNIPLHHTIKDQSYHLSADAIRALAIMGVVLIHTANAVYARPDFFGGISWWIAVILNSLARVSIPLFIMISGYFILGKHESFPQTVRRTWNRILLPFLFWFSAMTIWNSGEPSLANLNSSLVSNILTVHVFALYFFLILGGLYIVSPFLRSLLQTADTSRQRRTLFSILFVGMIIQIGEYLFRLCSLTTLFTLWIPYTGLFVSGFVFGRQMPRIKPWILFGIFSAAAAVTISMSYLYYSQRSSGKWLFAEPNCIVPNYFDSYMSVPVVAMSVSLFLLLFPMMMHSLPLVFKKLIYLVARASLGIYVLHLFFIDILDSWLHIFDPISPAWLYLLIKWVVIFTLSYFTTTVLIKIPGVKRVFGETK